MSEDNRLTPEEAMAFADFMGHYIPKETADYNLKTTVLSDVGDIMSMSLNIDDYINCLSMLEEYMTTALKGLKKTKIQLATHSDTFKRKYLERLYNKEE